MNNAHTFICMHANKSDSLYWICVVDIKENPVITTFWESGVFCVSVGVCVEDQAMFCTNVGSVASGQALVSALLCFV